MKRLLIIGASILQLPAIKKAKELGYYVGVIDYDPQAIGISFADEYFNVSTIDADGVCNVAKQFKPHGIMTLATDMPMRSVAKATACCGLAGISMDTAVKATDKGEMIKSFEACSVEHPWFYVVGSEDELASLETLITYPCIMKPTDSSGSRGVVLAENAAVLKREFAYTHKQSRCGQVIIEEYLTGNEVSVEVMAIDGEVHILQVTDKLTTGAPHFVEMGHSQPSRLGDENILKIKDLAKRAVLAVGITNGPAHVEIMLTKDGPKMIELGARMGGDCITTHLVPLSTGIDMIQATIELSCGMTPDISEKMQKGSAIRYFSAPCGVIKDIKGVEEAKAIPGVQEISFVKNVGDTSGEIGSSTDRIGFVISQGDTAEEAVSICEKVLKTVKISVKGA